MLSLHLSGYTGGHRSWMDEKILKLIYTCARSQDQWHVFRGYISILFIIAQYNTSKTQVMKFLYSMPTGEQISR